MNLKRIRRLGLLATALLCLSGLFASSASAAISVGTVKPEVGAYSATLTGSVCGLSLYQKFIGGFKYGTTTEYGTESPLDYGSGEGTKCQSFGVYISGLQPETTYHYKAGAATSSELVEGGDVAFTTASPSRFEAGAYPATLTAEQASWNKVTLDLEGAADVTCAKFGGTATLGNTAKSLTFTPVFSECSIGQLSNATVKTNGCTYVVGAGDIGVPNSGFQIACPAGAAIEFSAPTNTCSFKLGAQASQAIVIENQATSPASMVFEPELTGLSYTVTTDGFLCQFNGTGAKTGGELWGDISVTAKNGSGTAVSTKLGY